MKHLIVVALVAVLFLSACASPRQKLSPKGNVDFKTANVYYAQKNVEKAQEYYEKVLQDNPDYAIALRRVADINLYNGEMFANRSVELNTAAFNGYAKAIEVTKAFDKLTEQDRLDIRDMEKRKLSAWTRIFKSAEDQMEAGNTVDAVKIFELANQLDPKRDEPLKMLFSIYQKDESKQARAEEIARKLYSNDPDNVELIALMAAFHYNKDDFQQALTYFERIREINPNDVNNLLSISVCKFELKDYQGTLEVLQKVLILEPRNLEALTDAKITAYELKRKDLAFDYLKRILDIKADEDVLRQITMLLNEMENYSEMVVYAERWYEYNKTNKEPLQWAILAAQKLKNKTLENKFTNLLKQIK